MGEINGQYRHFTRVWMYEKNENKKIRKKSETIFILRLKFSEKKFLKRQRSIRCPKKGDSGITTLYTLKRFAI